MFAVEVDHDETHFHHGPCTTHLNLPDVNGKRGRTAARILTNHLLHELEAPNPPTHELRCVVQCIDFCLQFEHNEIQED